MPSRQDYKIFESRNDTYHIHLTECNIKISQRTTVVSIPLKENKRSELKSLTILKKCTVFEKKSMKQEHAKNEEFYKNCNAYFEFLRKKGTTDYDFEDEYYFTMPAISNH